MLFIEELFLRFKALINLIVGGEFIVSNDAGKYVVTFSNLIELLYRDNITALYFGKKSFAYQ